MKKIKKFFYATISIGILMSNTSVAEDVDPLASSDGALIALEAVCSGACSGCSGIWATIEGASKVIVEAFDDAEEDIAQKYEDDIPPILEGNRVLERHIAVLKSQIEGLQREILLVDREMVSILQETKIIKTTQKYKINTQNEGK